MRSLSQLQQMTFDETVAYCNEATNNATTNMSNHQHQRGGRVAGGRGAAELEASASVGSSSNSNHPRVHMPRDLEARETLRRAALLQQQEQQHDHSHGVLVGSRPMGVVDSLLFGGAPRDASSVRVGGATGTARPGGSMMSGRRHPHRGDGDGDRRSAHSARQGDPAAVDGGDDDYEALLALDDDDDSQRVPRGINRQFQRRLLKRVHRVPPSGNYGAAATAATRGGGRGPATARQRNGVASTTSTNRNGNANAVVCTVCQEPLHGGNGASSSSSASAEVVELPTCGHRFHEECVGPWLERRRTCPICRKEVYPHAVP